MIVVYDNFYFFHFNYNYFLISFFFSKLRGLAVALRVGSSAKPAAPRAHGPPRAGRGAELAGGGRHAAGGGRLGLGRQGPEPRHQGGGMGMAPGTGGWGDGWDGWLMVFYRETKGFSMVKYG